MFDRLIVVEGVMNLDSMLAETMRSRGSLVPFGHTETLRGGGFSLKCGSSLGLVCLCGSTFESRLLAEYLHFCRIDHLGQMDYVIVWLAQVSYLITCVGLSLKDSRCGAETQVSRGLGSAW